MEAAKEVVVVMEETAAKQATVMEVVAVKKAMAEKEAMTA